MRFSTSNGFYELNPFPGCNQIVVSNHAHVRDELRGKGHGKNDHGHRLQHIKNLQYDYVLCTVKSDNIPQIKILTAYGWKMLDQFHNRETGNSIQIWGRVIEL